MKIVFECFDNEVKLLSPTIFRDDRGYFFESYSKKNLSSLGIHEEFVQDNQSKSSKGTLRGLHFQIWPGGQAKLVRCTRGAIKDFIVDIRPDSPSFKQWMSFELSEVNNHLLYIPNGFAHGFVVTSVEAIVQYKVTSYYNSALEKGILWSDPDIEVDWDIEDPILSDRDQNAPTLKQFFLNQRSF